MKNIQLLFLCVIFYNSCDNKEIATPLLTGKWHLIYAQYGLAGYENFSRGDISWTFQSNNSVDVSINISLSTQTNLPVEQNGTFNTSSNDSLITINNNVYDYYYDNNNLILSDKPELEGPLFRFEMDWTKSTPKYEDIIITQKLNT